jgi:CRP-like cAMP-binding protein
MPELLDFLTSISPLSAALKTRLLEIIKEKELARKEYLLTAGKICKNIYYIKRGLLRGYYFNGSREVSAWFMKEGDLCISVQSFFQQRESIENIQAVENCLLCYISYEELQKCYRDFPEFNVTGRILTEKYYMLSEERLLAIRLQKAQDRYKWLLDHHPDLVKRVPVKYLASYIGITDVMLSVVRGKNN